MSVKNIPVPQLGEHLKSIEDKLFDLSDYLKEKHKWQNKIDARLIIINKCINSCRPYLILLVVMNDWEKAAWWQNRFPNEWSTGMQKENMDFVWRFCLGGFMTRIFGSLESSLRIITKHLYPEKKFKDFPDIYKHLLVELNLSKYKDLLDILRHLRNALQHNNNVFSPENDNNKIIPYKNKEYKFIVGKEIEFANLEETLILLDDVVLMLKDVLDSSLVSSHPLISDPQAG